MATLTIKTNTGFNTNEAFAFSNPQTTWKKPLLWIVKDSVSGMSHRWTGKDFTYDADGNITGGNASSLSVIDATGSVHASVKFAVPWDFATQGSPDSYAALLTGDDVIIGGAGDDVLGGGNGSGTNANGVYSYNGHSYLLSNASTWTDAQTQAQSLGGNLVTINDQAEQNWIATTFANIANLWIGYTDQETEGVFKWISGENSTYTNWNSGEPNNYNPVGGEDYTHIMPTYYGLWNDLPNSLAGYTPMQGIIEFNNINNGEDTLKGGLGNDTYTIDNTGDKVIETANDGTDTVNSSITYKLTANVENLTLTGSETLKGLGNVLDNIITGNSAANVLLGYDGNDTLSGGLGNDNLQGGNGSDTAIYSGVSTDYKFDYKNNILKITDTNLADGDDGVDTLSGVEELEFSNKTTLASDYLLKSPGMTEKYPFLTMAMFADAAYNESGMQAKLDGEGWQFINPVTHRSVEPNNMFINENAAATVAVKGNSLVVSFRGTDFDGTTLLEKGRDALHWVNQQGHYDLFADLRTAIKDYVADPANGIKNVYVTGHSLGGVMATWYLTDNVDGGNYLKSTGINVSGASFAPPEALGWGARDFKLSNGVDYYRFENAKDLVPDVIQGVDYIIQKALAWKLGKLVADVALKDFKDVLSKITGGQNSTINDVIDRIFGKIVTDPTIDESLIKMDWIGQNPGHQINLLSTDFSGYVGAVTMERHSMSNDYFNSIQLLSDLGVIEDFDYARYEKNIAGDYSVKNDYDVYDAIQLKTDALTNGVTIVGDDSASKQSVQAALDIASWIPGAWGTAAGFFDNKREFGFAEKYTEDRLVIGSNFNDELIGDGAGSGNPTNDLFYVGKGNDTVYGHQTFDDNGGIDVVAYKFSDTLIAKNNIAVGSVSGDLRHDVDAVLDTNGGLNEVNINLDGSTDKLVDIERLHFVDTASDLSNLLAGNNGNNKIDGQGGNDYLFGNAGNDILTGGLGNDRIHGGKGVDTAKFAAGNYDFQVKDFALQVTNTTTHETDSLYSVENITVGSVTRTAADIVWKGATAFNADGGTGLYSALDAKLLNLYAPAFGYTGTDADNLTVYGHAIQDSNTNKYTALQYELRETDTVTNDHWYLEILLGDDYLPKSFATLLDEASTSLVDPTAQVRNVWDTDVTHTDTHPFVYLDLDVGTDDVGPLYLTQEAVTPSKWLVPSGLVNGTQYSLQLSGFDSIDFDYRSNSDTNDDIDKSDLYEIQGNPNGDVKLVGLPSGQMEMGFLFAGTPLANLGHFDLV